MDTHRIKSLLVTGIPGLQKILTLSFIGIFYGLETVGLYVNDTFIIQIVCMFSSLNWCTILLVDINKYPSRLRTKFYSKITFYCLVYSFIAVLLIFILHQLTLIVDFWGSAVYLVLFGVYQLWRHYCISQYKYSYSIFLDLVVMVFSFFMAIGGGIYGFSPVLMMAIGFVIPILVFYINDKPPILLSISFFTGKINRTFQKRSWQIAVANFSTGSIPLFIAPLSYNVLSSEYTAIIGLFNNIANIILLVPRAISLNMVPKISLDYRNKTVMTTYKKFRKTIYLFLSISFIVIVVFFVALYALRNVEILSPLFEQKGLYLICFLMLLATLASQTVLPISNLLMVLRREAFLLRANIISILIFVVSFLLTFFYFKETIATLFSYQVLMILVSFFRLYLLTFNLKRI